jgi:integrase
MGEPTQVKSSPKTAAGRRTVAIPPNVLDLLGEHLASHVVGTKPSAWLFATASGSYLSPRNSGRVWEKARRAAGRTDLRLHDLRHTGLTWAAAQGATDAELMAMAGHKDYRASMRYQHATKDRARVIANALADFALADVVDLDAKRAQR